MVSHNAGEGVEPRNLRKHKNGFLRFKGIRPYEAGQFF
jgi:hypothetical protein